MFLFDRNCHKILNQFQDLEVATKTLRKDSWRTSRTTSENGRNNLISVYDVKKVF